MWRVSGFVWFLSRQVELLTVRIIEFFFFWCNVLPVFLQWRNSLERNVKQLTKEEVYGWYHILFRFVPFFFRLVWVTCYVASSPPFSLEGKNQRFRFNNQPFFVISPIKSIPFLSFFTGSFAVDFGITCGRRSFVVHFGDPLQSRDHLQYCTVPTEASKNQFKKVIW